MDFFNTNNIFVPTTDGFAEYANAVNEKTILGEVYSQVI